MWNRVRSFFSQRPSDQPTSLLGLHAAVRAAEVAGESLAHVPTVNVSGAAIDQSFLDRVLSAEADAGIRPGRAEHAALEAFTAVLESDLADRQLIPRLPAMLPRLMSTLRDPASTNRQLASLIGRDMVSVSEVLRLANSPFYRRSHETRSLEQAVLVIGREGLKQMVSNLLVKPIFGAHQGRFSAAAGPLLWEQSEKAAVVNAALAKHDRADEFDAYLAGISSNLGLLVGCRVLDKLATPLPQPHSQAFREQWLNISRQLSARVIRLWDFPGAACDALDGLLTVNSQLPADSVRLYSAERFSRYHCLHDGLLPVVDAAVLRPDPLATEHFTLAMGVLARFEQRRT